MSELFKCETCEYCEIREEVRFSTWCKLHGYFREWAEGCKDRREIEQEKVVVDSLEKKGQHDD
jgi:hypothetical protein